MDFWKIQPFSSSVQNKQKNRRKIEATIIFSGFWNLNVPLILNRVLSNPHGSHQHAHATSDFNKNFFSLMNNSVFGELIFYSSYQ